MTRIPASLKNEDVAPATAPGAVARPSAGASSGELLSPLFMQSLDKLDVLSRKILSGKLQGDRRSKQRGQSVEFADYRPYVAGDDLRFIDWNLYARLDKLFLRLFMEEQDMALTVAIDLSRSMDYGSPKKSHFARQLAAALGYIGLVNYNRVSVYAFAGDRTQAVTNLRGRRPVRQMLTFLSQPMSLNDEPGAVSLEDFTRRLARSQPGKGIIVLVSDFMDKGDLDDALKPVSSEKWDVHAIQILSPQELDPARAGLSGDLRLRDVEDGQDVEVTISPELFKRYRENLEAYCSQVRQHCLKRGVSYALADTGVSFETLVLEHLRQRGLLT